MSNVNTVAISGNLTRDPELKHLPSGTACVELGVAVNKSKKVEEEWVDETSFFDVSFYGNFAELIDRKFNKGDAVSIQGELKQDRWVNQEDQNRSKVTIVGRQLDGPSLYKSASETPAPAPAAEGAPPAAGGDGIPF